MLVSGRRWPRGRAAWAHLTAIGVLLCVAPFLLFSWAAQHLPSGLSSIYNATTPIMTMLIALTFLPEERLTRLRTAAMLMAAAGVVLVAAPWRIAVDAVSPQFLLAQAACLGGTICYGLGFTYSRRFLRDHSYDPTTVAASQIGAAALVMILLAPFVGLSPTRPTVASLASVAVLGVIGTGELASDLHETERKKADGYVAFKIKVGIDAPLIDAERTRRVCQLIGPDALISSDANQGWSTEQAVQYVRAVADAGLDFFEQPVQADDLAGMAAVAAAAGKIAVGADEGIHSVEDIRRHHERHGARGMSLKAIKLGGMRGATEAGRLCDALGLNVNVSAKTGESSIACAAATHIAAALPQIAWGLTLTNEGLAEDVTSQPVRIVRGHVEVSDRPGLGVDVDEERVRRYRREAPVRQVA
jgi:L-alanine-DL-glutamate epimerase-like enolase superfamily enzyme/multidrug transporter EmrE-like cation transporter